MLRKVAGERQLLSFMSALCNVQIFSYKFVCAISRILYNVYKCSLSFVIPLMINSGSSGCGNIYGLIQWYKRCVSKIIDIDDQIQGLSKNVSFLATPFR